MIEAVDSGSMTEVYRAREKGSGLEVALKVLPLDETDDDRRVEYFLREISISRTLAHPNIVPVVGAGRSGDELWLATRWVDGSDLDRLVQRQGPLRPRDVVQIGTQVLEALSCAHDQGVVHRDMKPANILIQEPGPHAFVVDFGVSRSLQSPSSPRLTTTGAILGTPQFMAPEQVGNAKHAGPQADIFGVGASLYHALTGAWHYDQDAGSVWRTVLRGDLVPMSERRDGLPAPLRRVVERALDRNPSQRFRTAKHMYRALLSAGD